MVRNTCTLVQEKGVLVLPEPKRDKAMPLETLDVVKLFYQDDEHSRHLPGKKDFVSISKNVHRQKKATIL